MSPEFITIYIIKAIAYIPNPINNPSIIAAIINSGRIISKNTLRESNKNNPGLSLFITFSPIFNPSPIEINIAGSSKIPWGSNLHKTSGPSDSITLFIINPIM